MQKNSFTRFIEGAGGCIVSKRILSGESPVKWMFREKSINEIDNGWRFFSSMDDDDYVNNVNNLAVCDFNTVANIEPLVLGYYTFPVGSDLQLAGENGKTVMYDNNTGEKVEPVFDFLGNDVARDVHK